MNTQIQQINTEIDNIQESIAPLYEKQSQLEKEIGQGIANYLVGRWRKATSDVNNTPIVTVRFDQFETQISIKSVEKEHSGEIRFYHKQQRFGGERPYQLGWYASNANPNDLRHLFYLEILGIVANEMRNHETSEMVKLINEGVGRVRAVAKLINKAELEISTLVDKRRGVEYHIAVEEILKAGGVSHSEPVYEYIRNNSRHKTRYQHIVIGKQTGKTIELIFNNENGQEQNKYRLPSSEAIGYLVEEYRTIKKKESEKALEKLA